MYSVIQTDNGILWQTTGLKLWAPRLMEGKNLVLQETQRDTWQIPYYNPNNSNQ